MLKKPDKTPFVSIVMPVRNEADFIESALKAVLRQDYPHDLTEIIIADGLSTDSTRTVIERLETCSNIPIKIVDNPEHIAPTGLNRAITASKGEIIVRVDGHCEIAPDYVSSCVKHLYTSDAEGVGGPIETVGGTLTAKAIAAAMSSNFGVGGSAFRCAVEREMYVDTVAFPGYRREIFNRVGMFNEEFVRNQDDEFNYRIRKNGGKILLTPDIRSRYYSRSSFKSLARQYFQYGFWKVRVLQLHPKQMSLRQFVPFIFVSTVFILLVGGIFSTVFAYGAMFISGLYFAAAILAALRVSARMSPLAIPSVFLSFPILHFSYGFGFAAGLAVFNPLSRRKDFRKIPEVS